MEDKSLGIYIHVPFCLKRCDYCGFYSNAVGDDRSSIPGYFDALKEELLLKVRGIPDSRKVDTIYFGGGTPSLAAPEMIGGLLSGIKETFDVDEHAEISMEANPGTVVSSIGGRGARSGSPEDGTLKGCHGEILGRERLEAYKDAGVNRLSIGLQSFDEKVLKRLGRVHTSEDFLATFRDARSAGFDNINVDLMFGIPGMDMDTWEDTLLKTIYLGPEHISCYSLQIEEGTRFYRDYKDGKMEKLDTSLDRKMYHRAIDILAGKGYERYEISNFALPGRECRHNIKYWRFRDYLGLGASASSFVSGVRTTNISEGYRSAVEELAPRAGNGETGKEDLNKLYSEYHENGSGDDVSEYMFTGLRMSDGIDARGFREKFGADWKEVYRDELPELKEYFDSGELKEDAGRLYLSEEGIDISNDIMSVFCV